MFSAVRGLFVACQFQVAGLSSRLLAGVSEAAYSHCVHSTPSDIPFSTVTFTCVQVLDQGTIFETSARSGYDLRDSFSS